MFSTRDPEKEKQSQEALNDVLKWLSKGNVITEIPDGKSGLTHKAVVQLSLSGGRKKNDAIKVALEGSV